MTIDVLAAVPKSSALTRSTASPQLVAVASQASTTPVSPTLDDQITFMSGITKAGVVAATTFLTWNSDTPPTYDPANSTAAKWGGSTAGTAGGTEKYFFDPAANWTATEKAAFTAGLALWSAVVNIQFVQASSAATADLTFKRGATVNGVDSGAFESAPSQQSEAIGSKTLNDQGPGVFISINTSSYGWQQLGSYSYAGGYGVTTVVHEEGHFLGLGHDGAYNGNVNPATDQYSAYDSRLFSLMSYIEPEATSAKYFASYTVKGTSWLGNEPTTWMPDDIVAAQRLYGVAVNTPLSGGQVFGYNTNITGAIKSFFDFTVNTMPVITLWDAGTGNTLNLSGCTTACTVNLNGGTYSSFDGMVNNMAIAAGTAIDGYVGGSDDDMVTVNADADTIDGGAGTNTVVLAGTRAQYALTQTGLNDSLTLISNGIVDKLAQVQNLVFTDQALQTQYNADGSIFQQDAVTTLANGNIKDHFAGGSFFVGKSYASYDNVATANGVLLTQTKYNAAGQVLSTQYFGVTGQPYQSYQNDYVDGNYTDAQYFYTGVTGQTYTSETVTVSAAGKVTAISYGGITTAPYSSYEADYANGLFAGAIFTYTQVPNGATYASFTTQYNFAVTYQGADFFFNITGQSYIGEEVDTNTSGATTRVLLTGVTGQPYQSLELDYAGGAYTGYKAFTTGITGKPYGGLEQDVTAAGQLTKVVYTGLTTTPYSSLEQDYVNGTLSTMTYDFTHNPGQTYTSYQVMQNAGGAMLSEVFDKTDGTHRIVGFADNLTLNSSLNDKITGGGASETFSFKTVFGNDTITDFAGRSTGVGHDIIDLSTADFGSFAAIAASAQNVSGGVAFTGKSGSTLTLTGLDKTALGGLGADFTFHA